MAGLIPDGKWLDAFTLPARVVAALFAFFLALFVLERWFSTPVLNAIIGPAVGSGVIILGLLLFGALTAGNIIAAAIKRGRVYQRKTSAAKKAQSEAEARKGILLGRLDHLSSEELYHIGDALQKGGQSFYGYALDPALATLMEKLLLQTPGGSHNRDHYPFTFPEYVWEELQKRKAEFIEKGEAAKKRIAAARKS